MVKVIGFLRTLRFPPLSLPKCNLRLTEDVHFNENWQITSTSYCTELKKTIKVQYEKFFPNSVVSVGFADLKFMIIVQQLMSDHILCTICTYMSYFKDLIFKVKLNGIEIMIIIIPTLFCDIIMSCCDISYLHNTPDWPDDFIYHTSLLVYVYTYISSRHNLKCLKLELQRLLLWLVLFWCYFFNFKLYHYGSDYYHDVTQLAERSLVMWKIVGSNPGQGLTKSW